MDYGNTKILSMHCRLGNATLSQLAFRREGNPEFPMGEISLGQYSCKKFFFFLMPITLVDDSGRSTVLAKLFAHSLVQGSGRDEP